MPTPDNCAELTDKKCKVFDISCALFHTIIFTTPYMRTHDQMCPFYHIHIKEEDKPKPVYSYPCVTCSVQCGKPNKGADRECFDYIKEETEEPVMVVKKSGNNPFRD